MISCSINWDAISAIASIISVIAFIVLTFIMWYTNKKQMQAQISIQYYKELRSLYSNVIEIENLIPQILHGVMIELQYIGDEKAAERLDNLRTSVKEVYDKTMLLSADYKHFLRIEAKEYCMIFHLLTNLIELSHRAVTCFNFEHISTHRNFYMPYQISKAKTILIPEFLKFRSTIPEDIKILEDFYVLCQKNPLQRDFSDNEVITIIAAYKLYFRISYPHIKVNYKDLLKLINDSCLCLEIFSFNGQTLQLMEEIKNYEKKYSTIRIIEQINSKIYIEQISLDVFKKKLRKLFNSIRNIKNK